MPLPGAEDGNQDHRANGAEDGEASQAGATSQEAEARSRTGSHCLGPKMRNQDRLGQPPKRPMPKAEDREVR